MFTTDYDPSMSNAARMPYPLSDLKAFAVGTAGEFEQRFMQIVDHAFTHYAVLLNAAQLRRLCDGGSQETAQRAINRHRQALHQRLNQRLSATAIMNWMTQGMPPAMNELSPKERAIAQVFLGQLARLVAEHRP